MLGLSVCTPSRKDGIASRDSDRSGRCSSAEADRRTAPLRTNVPESGCPRPVSASNAWKISKQSLTLSTPDPARPSAGRHPPKPSTNTYYYPNKPVLRPPIESAQYTSIRFSERLAEAGIQPSVGAVGSSYDNALAETINGLYKTELIRPRKPWRIIEEVELATAEWVDWFNHRRLYEYCGDIPPVELETAYYAQPRRPAAGGISHQKVSGLSSSSRDRN